MRIRAWNNRLRQCTLFQHRRHQPHKTTSSVPDFRFSSSTSATTTAVPPTVQVHSALQLGCIDYSKSWAWQHVLLSRRLHQRRTQQPEDGDSVLFLEHHPVYTLGRGADENHLTFMTTNNDNSSASEQQQQQQQQSTIIEQVQTKLSRKARGPGTARLAVDRSVDDKSLAAMSVTDAVDSLSHLASPVMAPNGVPIFRVERGGEVTFHGPAQLVVYPLLDLQNDPYQKDLHWYLRMVEEVVIQTLKHYGIESERDEENTGVWVGDEKVAAVGISSSRWITTHGFALNVNPDLNYFDTSVILPCGIEGKGVTSMAQVLADRGEAAPTIIEVADVAAKTMEDVFGVSLVHGGGGGLR